MYSTPVSSIIRNLVARSCAWTRPVMIPGLRVVDRITVHWREEGLVTPINSVISSRVTVLVRRCLSDFKKQKTVGHDLGVVLPTPQT